jgi:hypothetical protein
MVYLSSLRISIRKGSLETDSKWFFHATDAEEAQRSLKCAIAYQFKTIRGSRITLHYTAGGPWLILIQRPQRIRLTAQ